MSYPPEDQIHLKVVGVGGAGANAVHRMAKSQRGAVDLLALNTDVQALGQIKEVATFAIGPKTTGGMGSGGRPDIGRKAMKESQEQMALLLEDSDMVFITAGMGGGTGTGAASVVAEIAKRQGALTVGVVTLPFSFEGPHRRKVAQEGLQYLQQKVDTLIAVDNDKLLPSLRGKVSLDNAFKLADEILRQGVQGISEIIMVPGLINVDFADVKSVMRNGGPSFMAVGEGKGKWAAIEAAHMALSNPLRDAPLEGAKGVLLNIKGGKSLTLGQVHEVADITRKATKSEANIIFGVVQDQKMKSQVAVTLVATGLVSSEYTPEQPKTVVSEAATPAPDHRELLGKAASNGHAMPHGAGSRRLL